jgi:hypothetical protein
MEENNTKAKMKTWPVEIRRDGMKQQKLNEINR